MIKERDTTLSKNTLLVVFFLFTLIILGLEYLLYYFESNRLIEQEYQNLTRIAQKEESNLIQWYLNQKNYGELLNSTESIRQTLLNIFKDPKDTRLMPIIKGYLNLELNEKKYIAALVLDKNGNVIFSIPEVSYQPTNETIQKLIELTPENPFYLSTIFKIRHPIYKEIVPVFECVYGIIDPSSSTIAGFILFIGNANTSIFSLINTFSYQKKTLESLLLEEIQDKLTYLNDLRFLFNNNIVLTSRGGPEDIPGKKLTVSRKGISEGFDYRGERVIAYTTYISQMNWFLVIKIDKKEILIGVNRILYIIAGSIILILFLFIVVLGVLWKREEIERIKKELEIQRMQNLQNQKYQIISRYANDAFLIINKDGMILEANERAVDMYGFSTSEFKGKPFVALQAPEIEKNWNDLIDRIRINAGAVFESYHINKKGEKFFVEISAKIISIDSELFLVAIIRNIEDRKKTELQLIESEKKFHALFEQAYDSILLLKKDIIIDCNSSALKLFGLDKNNLVGKSFLDFIQNIDDKETKEFIEKINSLEEEVYEIFQIELKQGNGSKFFGEISLKRIDIHGEKVTQVLVRDITERIHFLEHLEKFKNAIENTEEMMMITDLNGNIEYVNPAFERITGYSLEEVKGKNPRFLKSGQHPPEFYENLWKTILSGKSWQGIIVNRRKDGKEYTEEMIISPIKNDRGEIISFVAIKKDVTERIKAEEELKRARLKAEESDRIKSNFLSMMSHEVRTPLNVILGFIDIIKTSVDSEHFPEKNHIFSVIERNSKRLLTLINDIIDISRIESNEMKLDIRTYEVQPLLMKARAEFDYKAKAKGLRFIDDYNLNGVYVKVDEVRFNQILSNLISNAIKFTSQGEIKISGKLVDNKVCISVSDTGIGIPKEFLPHIFEFFRQAEEGYNRNFEGAGLGLAITKKLVNMMKGEIYVESELGKGSKFSVLFPAYSSPDEIILEKEEVVREIFSPETDLSEKEPTVLIVEDNKDNSYFVEIILSKLGLRYFSVTNYEETMEILKSKKVDLILMDISLIGSLSGEEIFQIIRKNRAYDKIPIIAMTAHAMLGDREHFISIGFNDYIAKPFTFDEMTNLLFKYLKK